MILDPPEGGSATTYLHPWTSTPGVYWTECVAVPNDGWVFVGFTWTQYFKLGTEPETSTRQGTSNNPSTEGVSSPISGASPSVWGDRVYRFEDLTAHFSRVSVLRTVTVVVSPEKAGTAWCDRYTRTYYDGDVCTVTAKPKCSPWIFDHWVIMPGGDFPSNPLSFTVSADTTCIAYFRHTDSGNLFDQDGNILCSKSGRILYDGDNGD